MQMNIRRKEFVAEIKRLRLELVDVSRHLRELEGLANPPRPLVARATLVPEVLDRDEYSFPAKVAFGTMKSRSHS
jgi:hypothetical protein